MRTKVSRTLSLIALLTLALPTRMANADFEEECVEEECDGEELEEMHEDYADECLEETCDVEEVRELAGTRGNINALLDAFQSRGFQIDACSRVGACSPSPGDNNASLDNFFDGFCNQSSIDQHWDDFEMSKDDWDGTFGWDAPCNQDLPLGRTFNALNLLDFFGTSKRERSDNFLPFFYEYTAGTDELLGRCGSGCPGQCPGCNQAIFGWHFGGIDEYTELYWPFFYGQNVFQRAGWIVHESRHDDVGHDGGNSCGNGGSCDTTWGLNGANRYQILYLWWLSACADGELLATTGLRAQVVAYGNGLWNMFNTRPTRAVVFGPNVTNPGAPAVIPPASACPAL